MVKYAICTVAKNDALGYYKVQVILLVDVLKLVEFVPQFQAFG